MAFTANAVGRIRIAGNDANGAFYDASITNAGTDYSQQDAAQLALTDCAAVTGGTTLTSVTGGFTTAMIGNAIRISAGTHFTTGYYFITARTDTNTVTLDRDPTDGTNATGGTGKVGGGAATPARLLTGGNATGDKAIAGNTVYIRGAGSDSPSSNDYTTTSYVGFVAGTASAWIKVIGENGRPRLASDGLMWYLPIHCWFENLYLTCTSNSNGAAGILSLGAGNRVTNVVVNTNNQASQKGIYIQDTVNLIDNCEVKSGVTNPSASGNCEGIGVPSFYGIVIRNCYIHHMRDRGIWNPGVYGVAEISGNIIVNNVSDGITTDNNGVVHRSEIFDNTIDGNGGNGITVSTSTALAFTESYNNIISNNGGYGLSISAGSTAANDALKLLVDYNDYFTNTSGNYQNISAGANDQTLDPQYTNASGGDYSIGTNLKAKGFPSLIKKSATTSYQDIGAAQRQEAGGGGSTGFFIQ